jgi:DNA modification methylase
MQKLEWKTEKRKISALMPYAKNPRKLSEKQKQELKKSIEKFNLAEIPAINTDNSVLAGHQRLKILKLLGRGNEVIDVRIPNRLLTKQEAEEYLLRSNKNTADWDFELLKNFDFELLEDVGFDLEDLKELNINQNLESKEDDFAVDEDIETNIKVGNIFKLGNHRLMCGDSTNEEHVARLMDGKTANVIWTDPPYGVSYKGTNNPNGREWEIIKNDDLRNEELYKFLKQVFYLYSKYSTEKAAMYVCYASINHQHFEKAIMEAGFRVKQQIIWHKHLVLGHSDYHWSHEPIFYCCKEKANCDWFGTRSEKTVFGKDAEKKLNELKKEELIEIIENIKSNSTLQTVKKDNASDYIHPTQKPIALPFRMIINSSLEGMSVLDLFGGSGSTLIACEQARRKCFTMELDEKYCQNIINRWEKYTGLKAEIIEA